MIDRTPVCPTCGQPMPDEPVRMTESVSSGREGFFNDLLHPRAAKGTAGGGQFTSGGGGTGAKGSTKVPKGGKGKVAHKGAKKTNHSRAAKQQHGSLGLYAGYGKQGGDSQVRSVQAALNRLGVKDATGHALKLDGKLGPKTTAAIKAWQRKNKLPATGRVSAAMLRRLTAKPKTTKTSHLAATVKKTPAKPAKTAASKPTTTHISLKEADASKPYGDVTYADTGFQVDKKKRYPVDTAEHVRSAWSYISQSGNAAKYSAADLKTVKGRIMAAAKKLGVTISEKSAEAFIAGKMAYGELRDEVEDAVRARMRAQQSDPYAMVSACVVDLTDTDAVYMAGGDDLYQCSYSVDDAGTVTLGDPVLVVKTYEPAPAAMVEEEAAEAPDEEMAEEGGELGGMTEAGDRIEGRVIEAKGSDAIGGRIFKVRIIAHGDSKNGRRYPAATLREAAPLYEGSKAYDHHRTDEELRSSTINGMVGYYRNVEAASDGLYGDLHLLPGAIHAAEALDATVAAQEQGLSPLIGISHDVMARYRPVQAGGRRLQEATQITKVNSADLVADPAAGGKVTRMVAGGIDTGTLPENQEDDVPPTKDDVLAAFSEASDEELAALGLTRVVEAEEVDEQVVEATAIATPKAGWMAKAMIRQKVEDAGLPVAVVESLTEALPDRITEADVDSHITGLKAVIGVTERAGLAPKAGRVEVTQEAMDKKVAALDKFFEGDFQEGYSSFRGAWADFTGHRPRAWDEDLAKQILRESQCEYDSGDRLQKRGGELRLRESMTASSWNLVLGDSITRRMVKEYARPDLSVWRKVVSSVVPLADFRQQRIDRVGGYGTLPVVAERAPYQPLTSPGNEEASYTPATYGGTEDITRRMILNDDVRAISNIPKKLGLAAAQTLYRFVFDIFVTNAAVSYDSVALFHATHANTGTSALSQAALSAVRTAMRQQAAYGDTKDILSIVPVQLVVPSALEELAWQLATSTVALPSGAPTGAASDIPNIHSRMNEPIVIDYYSDTNDWFAVADMSMVPGIEIGFIGGRQDPELLTQSDPTAGSMFDRDVLTYKIRHEYGGTVLDHRGYYRNTL